MKPHPLNTDIAIPRVSLGDQKAIRSAADRILKKRGAYWESPLTRHHRRLREGRNKG